MTATPHTDTQVTSNISNPLTRLGWSAYFENQLDPTGDTRPHPARVTSVHKNSFEVSDGERTWRATAAGRLKHRAGALYPVTGDWALVTDTVITRVLTRRNALSRGAAGTRGKQEAQPLREQIIAANLDTVLIVCGLDRDFNLRRIERYLTLVYNNGLNPAVVLTKSDLHGDAAAFADEVEAVAFGVPVHLVSALDNRGLEAVEAYLTPGRTATMVGSSGAGKSTLLNRLFGKAVQATGSVSNSDGKGTHTTTARELILMPQGGMLIDNPGIREIAFWDDEGGIEVAFPEIERFTGTCRFADCTHTHEPGCRVIQALSAGEISEARLESYQKMKRELDYLSQREQKSADRLEKERWKAVSQKVRAIKKGRATS